MKWYRQAAVLLLMLLSAGCLTKIRIVTDPVGATIKANGEVLGTSPVVFHGVVNQALKIEAVSGECTAQQVFELPWQDWPQHVLLRLQRQPVLPPEVTLTLKCPPKMTITPDPLDAVVVVNGVDAGPGNFVIRGTVENSLDVSAEAGGCKAGTTIPSGEIRADREVVLVVPGMIEVGAFRVGIDEKEDLEEALSVLYKLKSPSRTVVIYDASGSMRWPLMETDQTPRFKPGQDSIVDFIEKANPVDSFGLVVFGHRVTSGQEGSPQRQSSCGDIELVVPLQLLNKSVITNAIRSLTVKEHRGDTPLEEAIRFGIKALMDLPGDRRIYVVTDGEDECGGNPARAAREAAAHNIKVHTLAYGIGISKEGRIREEKAAQIMGMLKDCANAGGGLFFNSKSAEDLYRAMVRLELAVFTYTVKDSRGNDVLQGSLGNAFCLYPGRYHIIFNTETPFESWVDIVAGKKTKLFIVLSEDGHPEISTTLEKSD